jgi:hypothetical protein
MSEAPQLLTEKTSFMAIGAANSFLEDSGMRLDGGFAADLQHNQIMTVAQRAEELLVTRQMSSEAFSGFSWVLDANNEEAFDEARMVLPHFVVLVPGQALGQKASDFFPAVVSEDSLQSSDIRLHAYLKAFDPHAAEHHSKERNGSPIGIDANTALSAASLSEISAMGVHGRLGRDISDAEHFLMVEAAIKNPVVRKAIEGKEHPNHDVRKRPNSSVTGVALGSLLGDQLPQRTITITKNQISTRQIVLLWHRMLVDAEKNPLTASQPNSLEVVQGVAYKAASATHSDRETLERLIAA